MRSVRPFIPISADTVRVEPWNLIANGRTGPLPEIVDGWDYATDLQLSRLVHADAIRVLESCELPPDTPLGWIVTWTTMESKLVGASAIRSVSDGADSLDIQVSGSSLGARIRLMTKIVLLEDRAHADNGTAKHAGSVLFEDSVQITLLGNLAQFPIAIVDFEIAGLDDDASVVVEIDPDPATPALAGLQLLLNQRDTELVAAASAATSEDPRQSALVASVSEQVTQEMLLYAVRHAEVLQAEEWEEGTIGAACKTLADRVERVGGLTGLVAAQSDSPTVFQSILVGEAPSERTGPSTAVSVLWPRLPTSTADAVFEEMTSSELHAEPQLEHPARIFSATGGRRATPEDLSAVRELVVRTAEANGFGSSEGTIGHIPFDRQLAPLLVDHMGIVPAEASNKSVWTYLSLVVAPDVTAWRFGYRNKERWIATDLTRHMFSRLWWQAYLLTNQVGDTRDTRLLNQLSESDLNQLLERTRLGGQRRLVQTLASAVINAPADLPRRDLIRETTLRTLRMMAFIEYSALTDEQLLTAVQRTLDDVAVVLRDA